MPNKKVTVIEHGGKTAKKILVKELEDVLVVTTEEEWNAARAEGRRPISVGFHRDFVLE